MCTYGYDAGVLAILPAGTAAGDIADVARRLVALPPDRTDVTRFRRFLLIVGTPSPQQLDAAALDGLQVAVLDGDHLQAAEAALDRRLQTAWGFVFAQRRLLLQFDPLQPPSDLGAHADYALRFLREHYPQVVDSADPDVPRGGLWLAPNRLDGVLRVGGAGDLRELCLSDGAGAALSKSLIEAAESGSVRRHWAVADTQGCVELHGRIPAVLNLRSFTPLQHTRQLRVAAAQWRVTEVLNLAVPAPTPLSDTRVLGPCEGCDLALVGPLEHAPTSARLAPRTLRGERLRIEGRVLDDHGRPVEGAIVYAHQTDASGRYPQPPWLLRSLRPHGSLRAWARSDAKGRYAFDTVRPGSYPDRAEPQHVHQYLIEPGHCSYYVDDLVFDDDPLMAGRDRSEAGSARGGSGITHPRWDGETWWVRRDLQLRLNVEGAGRCEGLALTPDGPQRPQSQRAFDLP